MFQEQTDWRLERCVIHARDPTDQKSPKICSHMTSLEDASNSAANSAATWWSGSDRGNPQIAGMDENPHKSIGGKHPNIYAVSTMVVQDFATIHSMYMKMRISTIIDLSSLNPETSSDLQIFRCHPSAGKP